MPDTQNISTAQMNARLMEYLDRGEEKKAQDAATAYTRNQYREESFAFQVQPPERATNDMLVPGLDDTQLQIIWELEPDSPAAKWVPLQTVPDGEYITGSRYIIPLARVVTPKFEKDLDELRTTKMDIRKVLTDNSLKDGLTAIDSKWITAANSIVMNAPSAGSANNTTGKVQWWDTTDPINRTSFAEATKLLPRGTSGGKYRLKNYAVLMNDVTARDFLKLGRDAVGGDLSEEFFRSGLTVDTIMGLKAIFTIKDDLVPDNYMYFFAAPEFLGKCFYLTDWTMFMKKEAYFIEMFSYWLGGFAFGNVAGLALARFNQ